MKKNQVLPQQRTKNVKPAESKTVDFINGSPGSVVALIIVFCVPVLLYLQTVKFELINFDDDALITENSSFLKDFRNAPKVFVTDAFTDNSSRFYRPLQTLSYMVDIQLSGEDETWMFHLTNILLLGLIACLMFLLLRKFLIPKWLAILSTLVFSIHPLFVSNVAWIPARGDLQLMLFSLLSFLFFIEFVQKKKVIFLVLNWVSFTIALFCKETAVVLPILFVLYLFTFSARQRFEKKYLLMIVLYVIPGIFWFWLRSKAIGDFSSKDEITGVLGKSGEVGFKPFLLNLQTIPESLANFFLPLDIDALPNFSLFKTALGLLFIAGIGWQLLRKTGRPLKEKLFGVLWFLILLMPTMLFKPSFIDYLHHRFFLPMLGIMLCMLFLFPSKWLILDSAKKSWIIVALIFVLSTITFVKSRSYADPMTFYNAAIEQNSKSDFAYIHRGYLYNAQGRYDKAMEDFTTAIEINPEYAEAYNNRGIIYGSQGEYDKAIVDYTKAIELKPQIVEAYNNRGLAYGYIGMFDKAIEDYRKVISLKPDIAEAYNNLGMAYGNQGIYDEAISGFTRAIELKPDYAQAYNNRAIAYYRQGLMDKACQDFKKAGELGFEAAKESVAHLCQ